MVKAAARNAGMAPAITARRLGLVTLLTAGAKSDHRGRCVEAIKWSAGVKWAALVLLPLAGCDQAGPTGQERLSKAKDDYARQNPVGRYQLAGGPNGGIYVLDTRMGTVRFCSTEEFRVACTDFAKAD